MPRPWLVIVLVAAAIHLSACCCCELPFRNFNRFQCRSKQSEAKQNLKALYIAQMSFEAQHERFGSLEEIGFAPAGETLRYEYVLLDGADEGDAGFVAEARGLDEMTGDLWQIDQTGEARALRSVCGDWEGGEKSSAPIEVMLDPTDALELKRGVIQVRY